MRDGCWHGDGARGVAGGRRPASCSAAAHRAPGVAPRAGAVRRAAPGQPADPGSFLHPRVRPSCPVDDPGRDRHRRLGIFVPVVGARVIDAMAAQRPFHEVALLILGLTAIVWISAWQPAAVPARAPERAPDRCAAGRPGGGAQPAPHPPQPRERPPRGGRRARPRRRAADPGRRSGEHRPPR